MAFQWKLLGFWGLMAVSVSLHGFWGFMAAQRYAAIYRGRRGKWGKRSLKKMD